MSVHTSDEAGPEGESSLYTLSEDDVEESEDATGDTDSEDTLHTQTDKKSNHLDAIQEQSSPTVATVDDDAAGVAKEVYVEIVEGKEETMPESEASEEEEDGAISEDEDPFQHEYITPIEDPYQKALKYFAKHGILELFGDITALIVLRRPENPYMLMVDKIATLHEVEISKGRMTVSDQQYVPPKRLPSFTAKPGSTTVTSDISSDESPVENKKQPTNGSDLKDKLSVEFGSLHDVMEIPENIPGISDDSNTAIVGQDDLQAPSHTDPVSGQDSEEIRHDSTPEHSDTDQEPNLLSGSPDHEELDKLTEQPADVATAENSVTSSIPSTLADNEYESKHSSMSGNLTKPRDDSNEPSINVDK